jgi:hypothetical protein
VIETAGPSRRASSQRDRALLLALLTVVLAGALLFTDALSFPIHKDEKQFWAQTTFFAEHWPPTLEQIRGYPEPMTPLAFLTWGALEVALGGGLPAGRASNLGLALLVLVLLGSGGGDPRRGLLAACGMLAYPYFVPLGVHLYTDLPAAFLVLIGFWLYARRQPLASAVAFTAAIATRQYMVTFPAALAAAELAPALLAGTSWKLRRTVPLLLATASLVGWLLFFEGLAPADGLARWPRHTVSIGGLVPGYGLYFLACVGAYFVVPEFLLYRRWRGSAGLRALWTRRSALLLAALAALFWLFPPLSDEVRMGALNRATLLVLPAETGEIGVALRTALFCALSWLTCLRFRRFDLAFWILAANFTLMLATFHAWEKYDLPILVSLWYLRSLDALERPIDLWNLLRPEPAPAGRPEAP